MFVVGGAAMALAYDTRRATRDIDAVFAPKTEIYECAAVVGLALGLSEGWLNDAVKGFLPTHVARPGVPDPDAVPVFDEPGLRVMAASPRYLLAMKLLAPRREDEADILWLCRHLGIATAAQALAVLDDLYPGVQVLPRSRFLIEELLGDGA
jgi:Nucleotidyltransferase of unknown function (DUF6036)